MIRVAGDSSEAKGAAYCVDTSSLLLLLDEGYPKGVFPSVWNKLESLVKAGRFRICRQVWDEIESDKNEKGELEELLSSETPSESFFLPEHQNVTERRDEFVSMHKQWNRGDGERPPADPYIIAHAELGGMVVVTEEKGRKKKRKSGPQIPDVCTENRVESMPLLELFQREGWRF